METRQTFERCNRIGSDISQMTKNAEHFAHRKRLQNARKANQNNFTATEHQRNLISMRQRIKNVSNPQNRSKNEFDPLHNPVRFFRKSKEEAEKVSLKKYKQRLEQNQMEKNKKEEELT